MGRAITHKAMRRMARTVALDMGLPKRQLLGGQHELRYERTVHPLTGVVTEGIRLYPSTGVNSTSSERGVYRALKSEARGRNRGISAVLGGAF